MKERQDIFDIAVIGGGPAGMMAAGRAAELGAKVVLIEKNNKLGKKLLLTGKGRCNLTNAEQDIKKFADAFGPKGRFLISAFSHFGPKKTIVFFEKMGIKTKTERQNRVFPESDKAEDVLNALIKYLNEGKVKIIFNSSIKDLKEIKAKKYILCVGGKSFPETGSDGSGFSLAKELGHTIIQPRPSLVPLKVKERWVKDLQGLTLKNVGLKFFLNGKKKGEEAGEILMTHFGVSGPIILDASRYIVEWLEKGEVKIKIDLKPGLSETQLDQRIQRDFNQNQNKFFKNSLNELLPQKIIPIIILFSKINPEKQVNAITKIERTNLVKILKNMEMAVSGTLDISEAMVTKGGIDLSEIDAKTMKSKIVDNLYFAGEIIDLDGPTGGYNLQLCWSTGYLAGEAAAKSI